MVQLPCRGSETLLVSSRLMQYLIYDDSETLRGTFNSIYDLERYIDGVRNDLGDAYPKHSENVAVRLYQTYQMALGMC